VGQGNCKPQPGDVIEIDRRGYQHWALYVGNRYVIHVTDQGDSSSSGSIASVYTSRAKVKKELLTTVAGNDNWRVNNKYNHSHTPLPVNEIIRRAESQIGRDVSYDLFRKNCEHFVTELRYGVELCQQV
ncbi:HRSL1 enzyme, partial [Rhabdornis inornatus]|nr:HRSL1 enzyme [Rhabdornis inornatus]